MKTRMKKTCREKLLNKFIFQLKKNELIFFFKYSLVAQKFSNDFFQ